MMKRILGLLVLLFSLQTFAGAANVTVLDEDSIDVTLEKGDADNSDKNPRTLYLLHAYTQMVWYN